MPDPESRIDAGRSADWARLATPGGRESSRLSPHVTTVRRPEDCVGRAFVARVCDPPRFADAEAERLEHGDLPRVASSGHDPQRFDAAFVQRLPRADKERRTVIGPVFIVRDREVVDEAERRFRPPRWCRSILCFREDDASSVRASARRECAARVRRPVGLAEFPGPCRRGEPRTPSTSGARSTGSRRRRTASSRCSARRQCRRWCC